MICGRHFLCPSLLWPSLFVSIIVVAVIAHHVAISVCGCHCPTPDIIITLINTQPTIESTFSGCTLRCTVPNTRNSMPNIVLVADSLASFKSKPKTHLYNQTFMQAYMQLNLFAMPQLLWSYDHVALYNKLDYYSHYYKHLIMHRPIRGYIGLFGKCIIGLMGKSDYRANGLGLGVRYSPLVWCIIMHNPLLPAISCVRIFTVPGIGSGDSGWCNGQWRAWRLHTVLLAYWWTAVHCSFIIFSWMLQRRVCDSNLLTCGLFINSLQLPTSKCA